MQRFAATAATRLPILGFIALCASAPAPAGNEGGRPGARDEGIARTTSEFLPSLVGSWTGHSRATIHAYSGFGAGGVMNVMTQGVDEGPATLRIRPDGTYTMHSDWTFSGCRVTRDHDGKVSLIGAPRPHAMRLEAVHFVEHVEQKKSWVSCKVGTSTRAPSMQFGLVWSSTGPMTSLQLTRHEDSDSPNTTHHVSLVRQRGTAPAAP